MSFTPQRLPPRIRRRITEAHPIRVASMSIRGLFGKITYHHIPFNKEDIGKRIAVIFGDNGTGKTTILKLLYSCLSWQTNDGLRTYIAKTPFLELKIALSDGTVLSVLKPNYTGDYTFYINGPAGVEAFEIFTTPNNRVKPQESVLRLEEALRKIGFDMLFVDHNRRIQSTYSFLSGAPSQDKNLIWDHTDNNNFNSLHVNLDDLPSFIREKERHFPLEQVVEALNTAYRTQAYRQGAAGEQNAAAVYLDIAKSITKDRRRKSTTATETEMQDVISTLIELKSVCTSFIQHGLLSEYPFDELIALFESSSKAKKNQIRSVLSPFLDSIQRRLNALSNIQNTITSFEDELKKYLRDKTATFVIPEGLSIYDSKGSIELDSLSSGEKQLVFLLCSAAIAKSKRSLILIDEPELSLNYKWQRLIAESLANLSAGGETQFILASHSIEIITRYVDTSFELVA